ncbi:hypothetical protein [Mailhella sp.]
MNLKLWKQDFLIVFFTGAGVFTCLLGGTLAYALLKCRGELNIWYGLLIFSSLFCGIFTAYRGGFRDRMEAVERGL